MHKILILVFLLIFTSSYSFYNDKIFTAKVTKVIDGNTLEILTESNDVYEVIFKDVDSPELDQLFGDEAKEFTKKLLLKKKVTVEMKGKDMWGNRLVGITLKNGHNAEVEVLKAGYAWHNILKSTNTDLPIIEKKSKEKRIGLWVSDNPTAPWVYRRKQSMTIAKSR